MKHLKFKTLVISGVALFCASCSDIPSIGEGEPEIPGLPQSDEICFIVSSRSSQSRVGSPAESRHAGGSFLYAGENDSLYISLSILDNDSQPISSRASYIDEQDLNTLMMTCRSRNIDGTKYYFSNTRFTKEESGSIWDSDPVYWWQNDESLHYIFYGYAPADIPGATYSEGTNFSPTLEYTVPSNVLNQADIVYNRLTQEYISTDNKTVPLAMEHALATISFVCGPGMGTGTINSVTLRNVNSHGILSLADGTWSDVGTPANFTANTATVSADNAAITSSEGNTLFMLIPQTCTAIVDINITSSDGVTRTYSNSIQANWEAGKRYQYTVSLGSDLYIDLQPATQDAHYVIAKTHVNATDLQPGQSWEMTVTADDGANATLLTDGQLNAFQRQGYWIDEIIEGTTRTNARGTSTVAGAESTDVYIFLPENVSDKDRVVTLSLKVAGADKTSDTKTFRQHHPAWTAGSFGWEQIDDRDEAQWGFYSNEKLVYVYNNNTILTQVSRVENMIKDIITQYDAGSYVTWDQYTPRVGVRRWWVAIDYSKLNNLNGKASSPDDGLTNTKQLNSFGGSAYSRTFEEALKSLKRINSTEYAFRRRSNIDPSAVPQEIFDTNMSNPLLPSVLKKNRYCLKKFIDSQTGNETQAPVIAEGDIVWYLPAYNQFNQLPSEVVEPISSTDHWSSTAYDNSTDAYLGNGSTQSRTSTYKLRVCRNRP